MILSEFSAPWLWMFNSEREAQVVGCGITFWCSLADANKGGQAGNGFLLWQRLLEFSWLALQLPIDTSFSHVRQLSARFAFRRDCRAANRATSRFFGMSPPVPKYISSGVCPWNAECGRWVLCCST